MPTRPTGCTATRLRGACPRRGTDEAATDTHVLELMGVTPEIGAKFTLTFDVDGHETTQTFTLCGWWEYDEAIVANHILIPESRADAILTETGVVPGQTTDGMTGTYNMDVMLKNGARNIAGDLDQILENHGYQAESSAQPGYIHTGVNWGYTGAQLSGSMDPATFIAICAVLLLIIFTGYLIILQCVPDLRHQRHPLLWPAEDHRHHPRQLRRIIRHQALALSLAGIPWGWCWAGSSADS